MRESVQFELRPHLSHVEGFIKISLYDLHTLPLVYFWAVEEIWEMLLQDSKYVYYVYKMSLR